MYYTHLKRNKDAKTTIILLFMLLTMLFSAFLPILFANRTLSGF